MKALLAEPTFLVLILGIGAIVLLLAFHYASSKKETEKLAIGLSIAIFTIIPYWTTKPFVWLHPSDFLIHNLSVNSALLKIVTYGVCVVILKSWFRDFIHSILLLFVNPFLGVVIGLVLFSVFWSNLPSLTFRSGLAFVLTSAVASHLAKKYNWRQLVTLLRWSTGIIAAVSAFYALAMPAVGVTGKGLRGILQHPNPLGALMGLNLVLWYIHAGDNPKARGKSIAMILLSLLIIQNTNSAGAKVTMIVLLGAVFMLRVVKKVSFQWAYTIIVIFMAISISVTILVTENLEYIVVDLLGKDMTLTGRVPLWNRVLGKVTQERPILGYGFHGFWQDWRPPELNPSHPVAGDGYGWFAHHAHNGFIDLFIDIGLIGLIAFLLSFLLNIALAIKYMAQTREVESIVHVLILLLILIVNNTQSELLGIQHLWFYYVVVSVRLGIDTLQPKPKRYVIPAVAKPVAIGGRSP
jgi:exopolysaccharide production protein ExoQ